MIQSEITAIFASDIKTVWDIVTNNKDYTWRSDITEIKESSDGKSFVEIAPNGMETKFIITKKDAFSEYAFTLENKMMRGSWTGIFQTVENGGTKIIFTENISLKNPFMRFLPGVVSNQLKKMQETYVSDLRRKLGE